MTAHLVALSCSKPLVEKLQMYSQPRQRKSHCMIAPSAVRTLKICSVPWQCGQQQHFPPGKRFAMASVLMFSDSVCPASCSISRIVIGETPPKLSLLTMIEMARDLSFASALRSQTRSPFAYRELKPYSRSMRAGPKTDLVGVRHSWSDEEASSQSSRALGL